MRLPRPALPSFVIFVGFPCPLLAHRVDFAERHTQLLQSVLLADLEFGRKLRAFRTQIRIHCWASRGKALVLGVPPCYHSRCPRRSRAALPLDRPGFRSCSRCGRKQSPEVLRLQQRGLRNQTLWRPCWRKRGRRSLQKSWGPYQQSHVTGGMQYSHAGPDPTFCLRQRRSRRLLHYR